MGNYFHGWRRKAGVATLVVALVSLGGWGRSYFAHDSVALPVGSHTNVGVLSGWGCLFGCVQYHKGVEIRWTLTKWTTRSEPFDGDTFSGINLFGFALGWVPPYQKTNNVESVVLAIPYWFVTVSMFLVSSRFLQSNPLPMNWPQIKFWHLVVAFIFIIVIVSLSAPAVQ